MCRVCNYEPEPPKNAREPFFKQNKHMRAGKHPVTGKSEIYLEPDEAEQMKEMVRGASLPQRRTFYKLLELL